MFENLFSPAIPTETDPIFDLSVRFDRSAFVESLMMFVDNSQKIHQQLSAKQQNVFIVNFVYGGINESSVILRFSPFLTKFLTTMIGSLDNKPFERHSVVTPDFTCTLNKHTPENTAEMMPHYVPRSYFQDQVALHPGMLSESNSKYPFGLSFNGDVRGMHDGMWVLNISKNKS